MPLENLNDKCSSLGDIISVAEADKRTDPKRLVAVKRSLAGLKKMQRVVVARVEAHRIEAAKQAALKAEAEKLQKPPKGQTVTEIGRL